MFGSARIKLGSLALIAAAAVAAPAHAAPAGEEYVLDLPRIESAAPVSGDEEGPPIGNAGIVGEDAEPITPLGAVAGAIVGPLGLLIFGPLALLTVAAVVGRRTERQGR